jgi:hypothetical protein
MKRKPRVDGRWRLTVTIPDARRTDSISVGATESTEINHAGEEDTFRGSEPEGGR